MTNTYASKLNDEMRAVMLNWWNGLSKAELLEYIAAQDGITADDVRGMFSNMNGCLDIGVSFSTTSNNVQVDFGTDDVEETEEEQ